MDSKHAALDASAPVDDGEAPASADVPPSSRKAFVVRVPRWGPSLCRSKWLAGVVVAGYLAIFLVGLVRFPYFGPLATVDEQLMYFQVARVFNEYGLLNSTFLQDFSNSSNPIHHPFVYNHMPPGPEILIAAFMKIFGESYRAIRLAFAGIFVIGIAYYVRFVGILLASAGCRGAGLALLLIPPIVMLHSIDHPAYSVFPFVAFFPVVALDTYYRTGRRSQYWFALLVVLLGSLYLVYQQLLMLFASWMLLGSLRIIRLRRTEVLALLATGSLGVVMHLLQSVVLLGPRVSLEELRLTISNRMFGVPTTSQLRDFYQSIAVVHQGFHQFSWSLIGEVLGSSLRPVGRWLPNLVFCGLVLGAVVLALVPSVRLTYGDRTIRIIWVEATGTLRVLPASVLWAAGVIVLSLMAFPAYAASYQLSGANHYFLAAVTVLGICCAVRETWLAIRRLARRDGFGSWRWVVSLAVCSLLLIGFGIFGIALGRLQIRAVSRSVQQVLRSGGMQRELLEIAGPLKGQIVMSNIYPSVVGFFSREATLGGCEIEAFSPDGRLNYVRNDDFEGWDQSTQLPLGWSASGADIRVEPDRREPYRGEASARLVVGPDEVGQLDQWVLLPRQPEVYRLAARVWVKTSAPRRVRAFVAGRSQNFGSYHPGDGTWRLLVAEATMPASVIVAPEVRVGIQIEPGGATVANVDAATLFTNRLSAAANALNAMVGPPYEASVHSSREVRPSGVDPSKCHAIWIRGYPQSTNIVPTHYVLFRALFTGFTMCREKPCLDQLEDYLRSRYPIVFQNGLGTVFLLKAPISAREDR